MRGKGDGLERDKKDQKDERDQKEKRNKAENLNRSEQRELRRKDFVEGARFLWIGPRH
jgi:hypothetical protein